MRACWNKLDPSRGGRGSCRRECRADLDDSDVRNGSAEKAAAEIGCWHNVSCDGRVLEEEEKLRTVVLGGSDEILVICARDGHGILWQRLGELCGLDC